jgi:hypothetical protein
MASFGSIGAVGRSIERLFKAAFEHTPPIAGTAHVKLIRSDDFVTGTAANSITFPAFSIFLDRIEINKTTVSQSAAGEVTILRIVRAFVQRFVRDGGVTTR